jgi:hypothetical protein
MIIGGDKAAQIRVHSVLARNVVEFEKQLMAGETDLMIIGYGFRDPHITGLIMRAVRNHGLRFFIVDPDGAGIARKLNPTSRASIYVKSELEEIFEVGLIGISSRPLSGTFGGDTAEYRKLDRFFS